MRVVFHGANPASFAGGFNDLLGHEADIALLPEILADERDRSAYAAANVVIGVRYDATLPAPSALRLFHVPGAGVDSVDVSRLPPTAILCNCFGHERAIAEYVMSAILARHVPLQDADQRLRRGDWAYRAGGVHQVHDEMAEKTIGLLGFGRIGKAIATRAKAFDMQVSVANRTAVPISSTVDRSFTLDRLSEFWGSADFIVVSVPLTQETAGIVNAASFAAMRPHAVLLNVGRGPTVDERALYDALASRRIAGAVIDTWYTYPSPEQADPLPSSLPFHELPNIVMTPHMSGWTLGTIRRRQRTMADNIVARFAGRPCINVVWSGDEA